MTRDSVSKLWACSLFLSLVCICACTSGKSSDRARNAGSSTSDHVSSGPGIDLNCVINHLQNPPEAFHYVYKKDSSDNDHIDQEADVSPQTIDGLRRQPDGSSAPVHALRSDPQSWQTALASLTGISGMSSTIAMVNHSSAMTRDPNGGAVNGYDTIHYSIDTSRFDATERGMLLKPGEFEKGDAWVTDEGCPVKLALDSELHRNDGSFIEKLHYEVAMVKK